jgi:hypothetical protein
METYKGPNKRRTSDASLTSEGSETGAYADDPDNPNAICINLLNDVQDMAANPEQEDIKKRVETCLSSTGVHSEPLLQLLIQRLRDTYRGKTKDQYNNLKPLAKVILEQNPDLLKTENKESVTPLQLAIESRIDDLIEYLCDLASSYPGSS